MRVQNVAFRIVVVVGLALGGFVFPLLFIVSAFVAWALFTDLAAPQKPQSGTSHRPRWTATVNDPDWQSDFLSVCESPAEVAFLKAMITAHSLEPDARVLRCATFRLSLQAELPPYRVDFLVDDWLVVEIDGAAYHSSPEAVARDQARDIDLQTRGFRVLRIPARMVFTAPSESVKRVAAFFAAGKPVKVSNKARPVIAPGQLLATVTKTVADLNRSVETAQAKQTATNHSRSTFESEKTAIESALEMAGRRRHTIQKRSQSEEFAKSYDRVHAELSALFKEEKPAARLTVSTVSDPPQHPDPTIDAEIRRAHQTLMEERANYFECVRHQLARDPGLRTYVKEALDQMGYSEGWNHISK